MNHTNFDEQKKETVSDLKAKLHWYNHYINNSLERLVFMEKEIIPLYRKLGELHFNELEEEDLIFRVTGETK